jgi:glycosyltransferase involved in cell wall biosynthesis
MRRILYFIPEPWPTFRVDVTVLFGQKLPHLGIFSDLVASPNGAESEYSNWEGGNAHLASRKTDRFGRHLQYLLHVLAELRRADPAVYQAIQVRDMPVIAAIVMLFARYRRIPFCYWMSYPISRGLMDLALARRREGQILRWIPTWLRGRVGQFALSRFVLRDADIVFVQSERMRDELIEDGVSTELVVPVPMGVDCAALRTVSLSPEIQARFSGRRVIAYLGTLDRPREIQTLFQMLAIIRAQLPQVVLMLVGDTRDNGHRDWLLSQARSLGVADSIHWTGWLPMADAMQHVLHAEVALSPVPRGSLLDCSSPTKVPEYLALGIPVVCNDNPDQKALIEASGAGTCVPYTAGSFAAAVLAWMAMPEDERHERILRGKEHVKRFRDYDAIALAVAAVYKRNLTASGSAS